MNGLVLIDKPAGCTSHDVVNRWRRLAHIKRAGHLGTLDPMATGLLALVTGNATRLAPFYEHAEKTYEGVIRFGQTSDTYDAEGIVTATGLPPPSKDAVCRVLESFHGHLLQTPPPVSAKKIAGVPAYKLARKKITVDLKPVPVEIKALTAHFVCDSELAITVTCSAGTYIRSLAHDLGSLLGCGALLSALRRTRIGEFSIAEAQTLDELAGLADGGKLEQAIIPASKLLCHFPAEHVNAQAEMHIRQGRQFRTSPFVVPPGSPIVRALNRSGELVAIGKLIVPNIYHPSTVFSVE